MTMNKCFLIKVRSDRPRPVDLWDRCVLQATGYTRSKDHRKAERPWMPARLRACHGGPGTTRGDPHTPLKINIKQCVMAGPEREDDLIMGSGIHGIRL